MPRLFWIIVALIAGTTLLLIANNGSGTTLGLANDQFARLAYMSIWGIVIAAGLLGSGIPLSHFLRNMAMWLVILMALVAGYQYRYELQDIGHRVTAGLVPDFRTGWRWRRDSDAGQGRKRSFRGQGLGQQCLDRLHGRYRRIVHRALL